LSYRRWLSKNFLRHIGKLRNVGEDDPIRDAEIPSVCNSASVLGARIVAVRFGSLFQMAPWAPVNTAMFATQSQILLLSGRSGTYVLALLRPAVAQLF